MVADSHSIFSPGLFENRHVLVTGGGTGIGFAIAREFGRLGARVTIAARTTSRLDAATASLRADGVDVGWYPVNIRDQGQVDDLFDRVERERSLPDFLINNAGGQFKAAAVDISPNGFRAVMDLNVQGTWQMCRAYGRRLMGQNQGGRIVNVVFASTRGMPYFAHAAAARAAVVNLTQTLALEWACKGILVNALALGVIDTPALEQYEQQDGEETRRLPIPRLGSVREAAYGAVFLCSPAGDYCTGTALVIDGGESLLGSEPLR